MMMNEFGRYLWVRNHREAAQVWKACTTVKFSGTNPKTIVVLCKRITPNNIMILKWSYDGTLLWAFRSTLYQVIIQ